MSHRHRMTIMQSNGSQQSNRFRLRIKFEAKQYTVREIYKITTIITKHVIVSLNIQQKKKRHQIRNITVIYILQCRWNSGASTKLCQCFLFINIIWFSYWFTRFLLSITYIYRCSSLTSISVLLGSWAMRKAFFYRVTSCRPHDKLVSFKEVFLYESENAYTLLVLCKGRSNWISMRNSKVIVKLYVYNSRIFSSWPWMVPVTVFASVFITHPTRPWSFALFLVCCKWGKGITSVP